MSDSMAKLLAGLGYDANQVAKQARGTALVIETFDPWSSRHNLAITFACTATAGCAQPAALR